MLQKRVTRDAGTTHNRARVRIPTIGDVWEALTVIP